VLCLILEGGESVREKHALSYFGRRRICSRKTCFVLFWKEVNLFEKNMLLPGLRNSLIPTA
jgi:hypothetical protein